MAHVGCVKLRIGTRLSGPRCLKSESEERETWAAESLRAAFANREGVSFILRVRVAFEETSAVDVLGNTIGFRRAQALRKTKVGPRQTCDQPRSVLSNLRV